MSHYFKHLPFPITFIYQNLLYELSVLNFVCELYKKYFPTHNFSEKNHFVLEWMKNVRKMQAAGKVMSLYFDHLSLSINLIF